MVPLNYIDAAEFCETSGSKVGWISLSDAQGYANDIFDGNITGQPLTPPFIFWTGIVRIDDLAPMGPTKKHTSLSVPIWLT